MSLILVGIEDFSRAPVDLACPGDANFEGPCLESYASSFPPHEIAPLWVAECRRKLICQRADISAWDHAPKRVGLQELS